MKLKLIQPLHDRVIVKPIEVVSKTASGIIIPDTAKEKPQRGIVFSHGNGINGEKMTVKEGDEVLYGKFAGQEIEIEAEKYLIMREQDIMAIL